MISSDDFLAQQKDCLVKARDNLRMVHYLSCLFTEVSVTFQGVEAIYIIPDCKKADSFEIFSEYPGGNDRRMVLSLLSTIPTPYGKVCARVIPTDSDPEIWYLNVDDKGLFAADISLSRLEKVLEYCKQKGFKQELLDHIYAEVKNKKCQHKPIEV